jgi:O-acetyl-ADP-ribose deacetylase (regulator of RNase III)
VRTRRRWSTPSTASELWGRGIALQFRKAFPENYQAYKAACDRKEVQPGKMLVFDLNRLQHPRFIINFPTKRHWKNKSRIEDIQAGLAALVGDVRRLKIQSIAIPPLGCGLGRLNWNEVKPLIEQAFRDLPEVRVLVYEPAGAPAIYNGLYSACINGGHYREHAPKILTDSGNPMGHRV